MVIAFLKKNLYPSILFLLVLILFLFNYNPGTYLTGWDNLQTELYPSLGVERAFFSVWQEYQSFGLVAGMAHAADLVRAVAVWILSLLLPQSLVRYVLHFLLVFLGALGIYTLLLTLLQSRKPSTHLHENLYAFAGAMYYLLNFGSIQILYVPFEAFTVMYGLLPWMVLVFIHFIADHTIARRTGMAFLLINFIGTSAFVAQQNFLVYGMVLAAFSAGYWVTHRSWKTIQRILVAFLLIGVINSFWLVPQMYFLKTNGQVVKESKMNQLATEDVKYQNLEKGTPGDFLFMNGFFVDLQGNNRLLFEPWRMHRENTAIMIVVGILSSIPLAGLFYKSRFRYSIAGIYILVALFLIGSTPPFSWANSLFRSIPIVDQIFRSPFTKWIIPYSLIASICFGYAMLVITSLLYRIKKLHSYSFYFSIGAIMLVLITSVPAFTGNYVAREMRVSVPAEYIEVMEMFRNIDPSKRIALLPDYTFWGWFNHKWGYNGSGFLWYGIKQPIVSRTFDVWNENSESYFWEIKYAIDSENKDLFEKVLEKYDIDYLIFDNSLLPISSTIKGMQYDRLENLLLDSIRTVLVKENKYLQVYKVERDVSDNSFVSMYTALPNAGPAVPRMKYDSMYHLYGMYISTTSQPYDIYFPYLDLLSETRLQQPDWSLSENESEFVIRTTQSRVATPVKVQKELLSEAIVQDVTLSNCRPWKGSATAIPSSTNVQISVINGGLGCLQYSFPDIPQNAGVLLKIESTHSYGRTPLIYVKDRTKQQNMLEERLQGSENYFFLGPNYEYGVGYDVGMQFDSYTGINSLNSIDSISFYSFPVEELREITSIKTASVTSSFQTITPVQVTKKSLYEYTVTLPETIPEHAVLKLSQSFDPGWQAIVVSDTASHLLPMVFGKPVTAHVEVNNWANGWILEPEHQNKEIVLIFWPQYLQFICMLFFFLIAGILYFKKTLFT